jgi:hypothetical protein
LYKCTLYEKWNNQPFALFAYYLPESESSSSPPSPHRSRRSRRSIELGDSTRMRDRSPYSRDLRPKESGPGDRIPVLTVEVRRASSTYIRYFYQGIDIIEKTSTISILSPCKLRGGYSQNSSAMPKTEISRDAGDAGIELPDSKKNTRSTEFMVVHPAATRTMTTLNRSHGGVFVRRIR